MRLARSFRHEIPAFLDRASYFAVMAGVAMMAFCVAVLVVLLIGGE
jgi:hypothetical protein